MAILYVVGIGPGSNDFLTVQAKRILEQADTICGYTVYVDLLRPLFPKKDFFTTPMTQEIERCRAALKKAAEGHTVALVCSGDAGVYGMAGPVLELTEEFPAVQVEVIPGLSAVLSGAAVLGAPLMHDFAVVSLSDLLTPWDKISARLDAAGKADFSLCLYNPSSRKRADYLARACEIILRSRPGSTPCGWVRNIGRDGQTCWLGTLEQLKSQSVDMFTTVFIGNSETRFLGNHLVTPRGYQNKR